MGSELANDPIRSASELSAEADVVVDADALRAGEVVRARLDAGEHVAGFVGDPDDPAVAEFVADVVRPAPPMTPPTK